MSDDPDKTDKMRRFKLEELARLEDTGKVLLQANDALVVHEFRRLLERQAEAELASEEMRSVLDAMAVGHVMLIDEIKKLRDSQNVFQRQLSEVRDRQDIIAAVCDAFSEKLEHETKAREQLVLDVADRD